MFWVDQFSYLVYRERVDMLKIVSEQVFGLCSGVDMLVSSCGVLCK